MKYACAAAVFLALAGCGSSEGAPAAATPPAPPAAGPEAPPPPPPGPPAPPAPQAQDAGPSADAGPPIVAPERTWTWIDVPGAACADGSPTGFAVNLTSASDDALVFLEGGGACWDGASCWGPVQTAFYVATGYSKAEFQTDIQAQAIYLLNRDDASNPFRDKNIVYVPYCTGDAFAGDNVTTLDYLGNGRETHFVGYRNMGLYVARMVATFTKAKRLWIAGDSAGGFGAAFNFGRLQDAFPEARVDVIDDSGQPIAPDAATWQKWKSAWKLALPPDCAACAAGPEGFVDYYRAKYQKSRYGLVSYAYDVVIAPFMNLSLDQFHSELYAMADHVDATWPNARYFVISGASHVGLAAPSPALKDWIQRMVDDAPSWGSTRP